MLYGDGDDDNDDLSFLHIIRSTSLRGTKIREKSIISYKKKNWRGMGRYTLIIIITCATTATTTTRTTLFISIQTSFNFQMYDFLSQKNVQCYYYGSLGTFI